MGGRERGGQRNTAVHQALSGRRYRLDEGPLAATVAAGSDDRRGGETFKAGKTTGAASGGELLTCSIHQKHSRGACTQSHAASLRTRETRARDSRSGSHLHVQRTDVSRDMGRLRAEGGGAKPPKPSKEPV